MRVGVFHWAFHPMIGGVETYILSVYSNLVKKGVEVVLLTGSVKNMPSNDEYLGVEIRRHELLNLYSDTLKKTQPYEIAVKTAELIDIFIQEEKINLLHFQNTQLTLFPPHIIGMILSMKHKTIPYLLTVHDIYDNLLCHHTILSVPWDSIITISDQRKQWLMKLGVPESKIDLVYNGVDTDAFSPGIDPGDIRKEVNVPSDGKLIVLPARIVRRKSFETFIQALDIVNEEIPTYGVITGDGSLVNKEASEYKQEMDELIENLGLNGKIIFLLGRLSNDEIKRLIAASDIVTLSSTNEGFGLSVLEGMAMKKPVVCTDAGGLPEVVGDDGGIVVPQKDPQRLAEGYLKVLKDPQYAKKLAERGYKRAIDNFNIDKVTDHNFEIYKKILGKS